MPAREPRHLRRRDLAGCRRTPCTALFSAVRTSRPIGLSPAIGSSVRSRMMTFFFPASALTTAASGNGRKTLMWIEPTLAFSRSRR